MNNTKVYSYSYLYDYVTKLADAKNLKNTKTTLPIVADLVTSGTLSEEEYYHALMICRMMIDLNLELSDLELDILLAAAICHTLPGILPRATLIELLMKSHRVDAKVCSNILLLHKAETAAEYELADLYNEIRQSKLSLLITLCDRGNMVEQLHDMNSWQVRRFIFDTREYYIPMCIYAKEHYPELLSPIGILAEKMRNLTDVSEILMVRFEARETELCHEILALREENATIKGILDTLR